MEFQTPYPYRFNPWKHHLSWVCNHIELALTSQEDHLYDEIITNIRSINSNHVDIYTGQLSPGEIIQTIDLELHNLQAFEKPDFHACIDQDEFQLLTLEDTSVWVIREGMEDDRYIHFHPARNSPNAVRIHGNSWKTAIAAKVMDNNFSEVTLSAVNEIRKTVLNLSPVKDLKGSQRLQKAFDLLRSR